MAIQGIFAGTPVFLNDAATGLPWTFLPIGASSALAASFIGTNSDTVAGSSAATRLEVVARMYVYDGSNMIRARGDANGQIVQQHALSTNRWSYPAATGGIVNTVTAVTVAAAAGAGNRNYISTLQLSWDALTTATEFVIRDGAAGTVLWRHKLPAGVAGQFNALLLDPLKGSANTLLEIATLTATVAGGVFCNMQGYIAT